MRRKIPPGSFVVDRWKHRIVKRSKVWALYCPARGPEDLILTDRFEWVLFALTSFPCRHGQVEHPEPHGVFIQGVWGE